MWQFGLTMAKANNADALEAYATIIHHELLVALKNQIFDTIFWSSHSAHYKHSFSFEILAVMYPGMSVCMCTCAHTHRHTHIYTYVTQLYYPHIYKCIVLYLVWKRKLKMLLKEETSQKNIWRQRRWIRVIILYVWKMWWCKISKQIGESV